MNKLSGLTPESVFNFFEKICSIPHGSGNTKAMSDYLVSFAKENNLKYQQDELNNVIIFADGTDEYKNHEPVIIQGHMDMVCEKDEYCTIDMQKDGLDVTHNNEVIYAKGTTLGGDDGIAVAYSLAILADSSIPHPPLEVVITIDEETGMEGAAGIDISDLKGRKLINIDSEDEGIFTVSCAGGARSTIHMSVEHQIIKNPFVCITIEGLRGGHSGVEIHKNLANANKEMGKLLNKIQKIRPFYICELSGGAKDNAIPRSCFAVISQNISIDKLSDMAKKFQKDLRTQYDEPDAKVSVEHIATSARSILDLTSSEKVISLLNDVPNGIISFSKQIDGLVQTSLNLGVLNLNENEFSLTFAVRSSVQNEKETLLQTLKDIAKSYGGSYTEKGNYPAWEYKEDSQLRNTFINAYRKLYNKEPQIEAIHAGLECGLLSEKIPGIDCISFGPQMHDVHTSREQLEIASVKRTWNLLLEVLKQL